MKSKTIKIMSLITCLLILLYSIVPSLSYAIESGKPVLKVTASKTTIKRGEEVTVTVALDTNSNKNVSMVQTELKYDQNVFEAINIKRGIKNILTQEEQDSGEEMESYLANIDTAGVAKIVYTVTRSFEYTGTLYEITFKAKQDAKIGKTSFAIDTNAETYPVQDGINNKPIDSTITDATVEVVLPLESISLSITASELWVGETANLSVKYTPEDTNEKGVTYKSSNTSVATVSPDGKVVAVGKGTATITATGKNNATANVTISVKQQITGIKLNKTSLELEKGAKATLTATVLPSNADGDKTVTWTTSDKNVVTVDGGVVTAIGKGSAVVTATTQNGKSAECEITVGVPLKSISFKNNTTSKTMNKGENFTLEVVYNPADTDADKTIAWKSTDTSVATVKNGVVTAIGGGETEITATSKNGKTAKCKITVEVPLTSISIKSETSIDFGQTEKLEVTYNPVDTTSDKTIEWKSKDEKIAKISSDGTITAVGVGETEITATASNGQEVKCKVTILPVELNSISIKEQNITLNKGQSQTLTVIYNPENTSEDKTVTWSSSDSETVSIDKGVITALKAGKATITATVGEKTAETVVEVKVPLESIRLNEEEKILNKGESLKLEVTYNPVDTTADKTVAWSSTDDTVATVDKNGNVKTLKAGTAYIKAKVEDKEVSCKITVIVPLESIELNKETSQILKGQTEKLVLKLNPNDTTYSGKIEWTSSDNTIATVDGNGNVKGLKEGTTNITAKAVENGKEIIDTCEFTVIEIPLDSIAIDMADFELGIGRTEQLNIICNPSNTTDEINVEWSSSDSRIATVDENGVVKAISEGTAEITAKVGDKTATVVVTSVIIPITSISLEGTSIKVLVGGNVDVRVTVTPTDATYTMEDLKFTSSNSNILYVNEDGTVTAKALGKALLTVETKDGIKSQIEIEVVDSTADINNENAGSNAGTSTNNTSNSPKTGDMAIEVIIALMIISGIGIVVIATRKIRK